MVAVQNFRSKPMSIEQPFFCNRFTVEDYKTVGRLRRAFHHNYGVRPPHYEPVLLDPGGSIWHSEQREVLGSSGCYHDRPFSTFDFRSARWRFVEEIYRRALESTRARFPLLEEIRWSDLLPNWREIILPDCFAEAAEFMATEMERLTRSGGITIETGCSLLVSPPDRWKSNEKDRTTLLMILDVEQITDQITKPIWSKSTNDYDFHAPRKAVAFEWEEIAGFLYRPTPRQIELINNKEAKPPVQPLDLEMIDRVSHLDIDGALRLVDQGANINAADSGDETALTTLAETSATDWIPFGEDYEARCAAVPELKPSERIAMMRRLIEAGADVNLFFYDGVDVLVRSTLHAEPEAVQFLLEEGAADPNHNMAPEDNPDTISTALDYAASDCHCYAGDEYGEAAEKIYQMLVKHGAVYRRKEPEENPS